MTPAEYAFSRIMEDRGVTLTFIGKAGRRLFPLNGTNYTPDFYDPTTETYFKVSGTRQAYHKNKEKYAMFRATYPTLTLKIVRPDGQEIPLEASEVRR